MEVWKDIYFVENDIIWDYRGLYQVSNYGNVKSLERYKKNHNKLILVEERIMKPFKNGDRYYRVSLNGKKFLVHRLVAHMFVDGYFDGAEVDHIDTNIFNNRVENLKWCTAKENKNNPLTKECHRKKRTGISSNKHLIARYDLDMKLIDIKYQFEYVEMGFSRTSIWRCCTGKIENNKGFIFKYYKNLD